MIEPAVLAAEGLTKSYGNVRALRGVNLEVRRGEIFGFLGPNGAGKTTAIRCLLDLIRPDSGAVRVLGLDPQANPIEVRARTGYLPGELRMEANLRVRQVLRYYNSLRGKKADWNIVEQLVKRMKLDITRRVKNLSKGNKQKVGVVQALMHRPELLLLDEPTAGLDPLIQQEVYALLREAQQEGTTVFFSSHILSEVEALAERVAIIRDGVIVEVANTTALTSLAINRIRVRFKETVDGKALAAVLGATLLSQDDGMNVRLQIEGEMDGLIKALAKHAVSDFETERPSLEEIFLAHYKSNGKGAQ